MYHTDLFYETPKEGPTKTDEATAKELGIPAEAVGYIMETWEKNCYDVLFQRRRGSEG